MKLQIGVPRGYFYAPAFKSTDIYITKTEMRLFGDNTSLLQASYAKIVTVADYFFSPLSFAYCTAGIPGASILSCAFRLGHLSIGWKHGILVERCSQCNHEVLVTAFGGNLKTPSTWWHGYCAACRQWLRWPSSRETTLGRIEMMRRIVRRTPEFLEEREQFTGYIFSWSGDGLSSATKSRLVVRQLYDALPLDVTIHRLKSDFVTTQAPPVVAYSQEQTRTKFRGASSPDAASLRRQIDVEC